MSEKDLEKVGVRHLHGNAPLSFTSLGMRPERSNRRCKFTSLCAASQCRGVSGCRVQQVQSDSRCRCCIGRDHQHLAPRFSGAELLAVLCFGRLNTHMLTIWPPTLVVCSIFTALLSFKPLSFKHGDESGVPYLERGGVDISTCVPLKKKRYVVLLHVFNRIAFRWVLGLRARGKNAPVFQCRAMRYISCG